MKEAITPAVALAIKTQLKMSNKKYELLRSILRKQYDHSTKKYVPREVRPGQKLPNLFPPLEKVQQLQESLRDLSPEPTASGYQQSMKDLIVKILQIPEF